MFNRLKWKRKEKLTCNVIFIKVNVRVRGRETDSEVANAIVLLTIMKRTWHVKIDKRNKQFSRLFAHLHAHTHMFSILFWHALASAMLFIHAWRRKKNARTLEI